MIPLLPIPARILLCVSSALALTSLASPTPAAAQPMYRCVDNDGHVVIGKSAPDVPPPANCRRDAIPVPKAIQSQPVAQKDLEAVKQFLNERLTDLAMREARCRSAHETIEVKKDDALDAIDSLSDNRRNSRVSRAESRAAGKVEEAAKLAHVTIKQCVQKAQADIAQVRGILSSPEVLRAQAPELLVALRRDHELAETRREADRQDLEQRRYATLRAERELQAALEEKEAASRRVAERLSGELREQWLTVLENVRGVHEIYASGGSSDTVSDAFSLRLEAIGRLIQSIRVKYASQVQMGDHKALGMAVYAAYAALAAAGPDWQRERQAAESLASAEANAARYGAIRSPSTLDRANSDQSKRLLRTAQQQYEDAKTQLAARRDSLTQLLAETIRIAKEERERTQQVSAEARNP